MEKVLKFFFKSEILSIFIISVATLPIIRPLLKLGFFYTHDGAFHLVRFMRFAQELNMGQFPVRWSSDLSFNYGYPIFNYVYPLINYLAYIFYFLNFSAGESFKLVILLSTFLSSIFCYFWLRCHFDKFPSVVGTIFYIYVPFRLLSMYVTGQFGSLLVLMFIPLCLFLLYKIIHGSTKIIPVFSLFFGLLLISHNLYVLVSLPIFFVYIISQIKFGSKIILRLTIAFALGLGVSAFFILPALLEMPFVRAGVSNYVNYKDHFPTINQLIYSKWGYGFSERGTNDQMSFQVGLSQWLMFAIALIILSLAAFRKRIKGSKLLISFLVLFVLSIFLMLETSTIIWESIPIIQRIQFPWRLLLIPTLISPFIASFVSQRLPKVLAVALVVFLLFANRNYLRTWEQLRYSDEFYKSDAYLYNGTTDIASEITPIWVNKLPSDLPNNLVVAPEDIKISDISQRERKFLSKFTVESTRSAQITINKFYLPFFEIESDNKKLSYQPSPQMGLINFEAPEGKHEILFKLKSTPIQKLGNLISILSIGICLGWMIFLKDLTVLFKKTSLNQH